MRKLIEGLHHFKTEIHASDPEFFDRLAQGQNPEALFITCSDSRIDPNLLTQTKPGELFIARNAGNIIPMRKDSVGGEEATIEFAIGALGIKDIIVCGHSQCGAMAGLLDERLLKGMPALASWLDHARATKELISSKYADLDEKSKLEIAVQENVLVQLEHLKTFPCVAERLKRNEIFIHGWVYQIESGKVFIYDYKQQQFKPLTYKQSTCQGANK